jgi:uncharacterized membrane protein
MNLVLWPHIAAGCVALLAGTIAAAARKGGPLHARAGTLFAAAMLALGATATLLARLQEEPDLGLGGILTCYFVATSWMAARRRDGSTGRFGIAACTVALGGAAALAWHALTGGTTPAGPGPLFGFAGLCLLVGLLDLNVVLRRKLTATQRMSRHLWRMCVAFFIATGSFFIGQQDVLPVELRGSPILFLLGLAPLGLMALWLLRLAIRAMPARSRPSLLQS